MKKTLWHRFVILYLVLVTVLSCTVSALADGLSWAGDHKDGSAASSVATGGYSIMYGTAGKCVLVIIVEGLAAMDRMALAIIQ